MKSRIVAIFILLACSSWVVGQTNSSSPYSGFGIGDMRYSGVARNFQMGGLGVANSSTVFANNINPALLARTKNTIFDIGIMGQSRILKTTSAEQSSANFNLDYVSLAFPLMNNKNLGQNLWTTGIGLKPVGVTDYDFNTSSAINDSTQINYSYLGNGGINKFFWQNGVKVGRSLYLGAETAYLFGSQTEEAVSQLEYPTGVDASKNVFIDKSSYSDFSFATGIAFRKEINYCRDTVVGKLKCENTLYYTKSDYLKECRDSAEYGVKGLRILEPLNIPDTLSKEEKKRLKKEYKVRKDSIEKSNGALISAYCKKCYEDPDHNLPLKFIKSKSIKIENGDTIVSRDTTYIGKKIFCGGVVDEAKSRAVEGKYLILIQNTKRKITVHNSIRDPLARKKLLDLFGYHTPANSAVIAKKEAEKASQAELLADLEDLKSKSPNASKSSNKYIRQHLQQGSGIFLNLGASYEYSSKVKTDNLYILERRLNNESVLTTDTLNFSNNGFITLPSSLKFGLGLERPVPTGKKKCGKDINSSWSFGVDFHWNRWSEYRNLSSSENLNDSYKIIVGGEIIPNLYSEKGFLNITSYRMGAYFEKTPLLINGKEILDFGITFGLSLPMYSGSRARYLNLGFNAGQRGTTLNNLVRETYFNTSLSFTINSQWFRRPKAGL